MRHGPALAGRTTLSSDLQFWRLKCLVVVCDFTTEVLDILKFLGGREKLHFGNDKHLTELSWSTSWLVYSRGVLLLIQIIYSNLRKYFSIDFPSFLEAPGLLWIFCFNLICLKVGCFTACALNKQIKIWRSHLECKPILRTLHLPHRSKICISTIRV